MDRFYRETCGLPGARTGTIIHSSGTTGSRVYRLRSPEELEFVWKFWLALAGPPGQPREAIRPLALMIDINEHCGSVSLPAGAPSLRLGSWSQEKLDEAIMLLRSKHCFPGLSESVRIVGGGIDVVSSLTAGLIRTGIDPADLDVELLVVGGETMTPERYRWLRESWQAVVRDCWSCSEVFGSATRHSESEPLLFDPHVVTELVDAATGEPLEEGLGRLVLTELFPFSQLQPMVRLDVGDLFSAVPAGPGRRGFKCWGRAANSIFLPDGRPALTALEIRQALEPLPWVCREPDADLNHYLDWAKPLTPPLYRAEWIKSEGPPTVLVEIPVDFDPMLFEEIRGRVIEEIRERLLNSSPRFGMMVKVSSCLLEVDIAFGRDMTKFKPAV